MFYGREEQRKRLSDMINAQGQVVSLIREGMRTLGFEPFVSEAFQGPIITTFLYPEGRNLDFKHMHHWLKEQGYVIYPGKLTDRDTFRIGNIGEIYDADADRILELFAQYTKEFM